MKQLRYLLWAAIAILSLCSAILSSFALADTKFFSKDDMPFGKPYAVWVAKWWNWTASIPIDPETNSFAGLKQNGCLMHVEDSVVMFVDPAVGGKINQACKIASGKGILFPLWSGECDSAMPENEGAQFKKISECARGFDLGKISALVKLDNKQIAKLDVLDYNTNTIDNVTEIYTDEFNITLPSNTHVPTVKHGTFRAAAHGWFIFLNPLTPGVHTIYYQNSVMPTTLSGAANVNTAQITYILTVD